MLCSEPLLPEHALQSQDGTWPLLQPPAPGQRKVGPHRRTGGRCPGCLPQAAWHLDSGAPLLCWKGAGLRYNAPPGIHRLAGQASSAPFSRPSSRVEQGREQEKAGCRPGQRGTHRPRLRPELVSAVPLEATGRGKPTVTQAGILLLSGQQSPPQLRAHKQIK